MMCRALIRTVGMAASVLITPGVCANVVEKLESVDYVAIPKPSQSLRQALNDASPIRENGEIFHGYTQWHIRWEFHWQRDDSGRCKITRNRTALDLVITLPKLAGAKPQMQARFDRFKVALEAHEQAHARIARDTARAIDDTILRLPSMANCQVLENTANRRANALIDASKQQQIELDRITEHGRRDGARVD